MSEYLDYQESEFDGLCMINFDDDVEVGGNSVPEAQDELCYEDDEYIEDAVNLLKLKKLDPIVVSDIKNKYEEMTRQQLFELFDNLQKKWIYDDFNKLHPIHIIQIGLINFEILHGFTGGSESIENGYKKTQYEAISLYYVFRKYNLIGNDDGIELRMKFHKIFELIYYTEQCLRSVMRIQKAMDPNYDSYANDDTALYKFVMTDTSKNSSFQNLVLYLLNSLYEKKYRRYGECCYEPIYTEQGYYTYSWTKKTTISKFIYSSCKKELNWPQWMNLTAEKNNASQAQAFLMNCQDAQFPDIVKDRHVFSFKNGVYIAKYKDIRDKFILHNSQQCLDTKLIAAKYFDLEFDEYLDVDNWYDIPTPMFQSIMDYQFMEERDYEDICRWLYIFIGRIIYEVGELDDWQVIAFIKGVAGTGKGTILTKIAKEFYVPDDVGILSNDGESRFGLQGFFDKLLFLAPEIKGDLSLPQAQFQSMVSGEDLVVPVKYQVAESIVWKTPGLLAGNETPNYTDNSGSLARRLIIWTTMKKVNKNKIDPQLGNKLKKEIPSIIKKCNMAYLEAIEKYVKNDIWQALPQYFIFNQNEMTEQTNSLQSFLMSSGKVSFGHDNYITEQEFKYAFNIYCKENSLVNKKYTRDLYTTPFANCSDRFNTKIEVKRLEKKRCNVKGKWKVFHGTFIQGLCLHNDSSTEEPIREEGLLEALNDEEDISVVNRRRSRQT